MSAVALSGEDTITLNGTLLTDLADGDCVDLTFPNKVMEVKTGKDGNTIYAQNTTGANAESKIRVLRGGQTDQFLNGLLSIQDSNPSAFPLMFGQYTKKFGNGKGPSGLVSDIYVLSGGVFYNNVGGKTNVEGNTDQSVAEYTIKWASAFRAIS